MFLAGCVAVKSLLLEQSDGVFSQSVFGSEWLTGCSPKQFVCIFGRQNVPADPILPPFVTSEAVPGEGANVRAQSLPK